MAQDDKLLKDNKIILLLQQIICYFVKLLINSKLYLLSMKVTIGWKCTMNIIKYSIF